MTSPALSETECHEEFVFYRQHLQHIPDAWLHEIAFNGRTDAMFEPDPMDVIKILSTPGDINRIQMLFSQNESAEDIASKIHAKIQKDGVDKTRIIAGFMTIHAPPQKPSKISEIFQKVSCDCKNEEKNGWCWYLSPLPSSLGKIDWIFITQADDSD